MPLTPSHLLVGRRLLSLPSYSHKESNEEYSPQVTKSHLSRRFRHLNTTLDQFWRRWQSEYLLELREHHCFNNKGSPGHQIALGDTVVVHSNEKRCGFWNLGKIEELFTGRDGLVRAASVRVYTGERRPIIFCRPLQHLDPLEINAPPEMTQLNKRVAQCQWNLKRQLYRIQWKSCHQDLKDQPPFVLKIALWHKGSTNCCDCTIMCMFYLVLFG